MVPPYSSRPTSTDDLMLHSSPSSNACFHGLTCKDEGDAESHASAPGTDNERFSVEHDHNDSDEASSVHVQESSAHLLHQCVVPIQAKHGEEHESAHSSTLVDMSVQHTDKPAKVCVVEQRADVGSTDQSFKTTHSYIVSNPHIHVADSCRGATPISMEGPSTGVMSICGIRPEMEDAVTIAHNFHLLSSRHAGGCSGECLAHNADEQSAVTPLHFFAVYDGHGGSQVSTFCKERLHIVLTHELRSVNEGPQNDTPCTRASWEKCWETAMFSSFHKVDAEIEGFTWRGAPDNNKSVRERISEPRAPETVGSTAIVAVVGSHQIVIANCGDSRAVLSRGGQAIALSIDHKPNREDEMARIEAAGGRVICWNGYRVFGVLAMSRAIGDRYLKPYVIPEPEVKCISRTEDDECLILASDGLWDVMKNEEVCEVARRCLTRRVSANEEGSRSTGFTKGSNDRNAEAAATLLTKMALAQGSHDNISVIVIDLKNRKRS